jgi:hypothetical protein
MVKRPDVPPKPASSWAEHPPDASNLPLDKGAETVTRIAKAIDAAMRPGARRKGAPKR